MVNIGFIAEGPSDARIIRSEKFSQLLATAGLHLVDVIVPEGKTHFLHPHAQLDVLEQKVQSFISRLKDMGAEKIFFLVDQDTEPCFTAVKSKIPFSRQHTVIVCRRALEAWYLADTPMMCSLLKTNFICNNPENDPDPFETIKVLMQQKLNRGVGDKITLANKVLREGFSIQNASQHTGCASAAYFVSQLQRAGIR